MLTEIFQRVLLMSAVGGALSVVLLCVKPMTRRLFSPNWQYYIWLTVLLVMVLPVRFELPEQAVTRPDGMAQQGQSVTDGPRVLQNTAPEPDTPVQPEPHSLPRLTLPRNVLEPLCGIWLAGAVLVLLVRVIRYHLFLRTIQAHSTPASGLPGLPARLEARRTNLLDAPLLLGLTRPVLYLPERELSEGNLKYILLHELTHCRRRDLWYKWFAMLVWSVHWFNPLMFLVSKQIDLECEVSCDYTAAHPLTRSEQDGYMNMILDLLAASKNGPCPLTTQMAGGRNTLKRRFEMIRSGKKPAKFVSVLSAVVAVLVLGTSACASNALSSMAQDGDSSASTARAFVMRNPEDGDSAENMSRALVTSWNPEDGEETPGGEELKAPENTISGFFEAFSGSDFTRMKTYCTEHCAGTFFGDGHCFGMAQAALSALEIDPLEYAKSSNDFNAFVTVSMTPHETSVFDPSEHATSFYVVLQRQPDGRYLIDDFVTGLDVGVRHHDAGDSHHNAGNHHHS